jgi:hypothetical protein
MTDSDIAEIEARLKAATPGPWVQMEANPTWIEAPSHCERGAMHIADVRGWGHLTGGGHGAHGMGFAEARAIQDANGAFISHAPTDIAALLEEVKRLRAELAQEQEQVASVHTSAKAESEVLDSSCTVRRCGNEWPFQIQHVQQECSGGCVIASLAMVSGRTFKEVQTEYPWVEGDNGCDMETVTQDFLTRHGIAWQRLWGHVPYRTHKESDGPWKEWSEKHKRNPWPAEPWTEVHLCMVRTAQYHCVVLLRDGTVLDPLAPQPKKLSDYSEVTQMWGLFSPSPSESAMREALDYVEENTYCGHDGEWHFKPGYNPRIVSAALQAAKEHP